MIRGCVPKKLLVYASRFSHEFADAAGFGWTVPHDFVRLADADRQQGQGDRAARGAYRSNLEKAGVEIVKSRAVIEDGDTIRLLASGARVRAANILIATGGTPHPGHPIPGIEHAITSNEAFHLPALPAEHRRSRAAATSRSSSPASSPGSARG